MSSSDSLFSALPQHVQNAIDNAFYSTVISYGTQSFQKKTDNLQAANVSVSEFAGGGGFLAEDTEMDSEAELNVSDIPFELISTALQRLDLPPDDEEVLSVFKNAATGWASTTLHDSNTDAQAKYVSKDDWRSVCAVLLEHRAGEIPIEGSTSEMDENEDPPSDDYIGEQSGDSPESDSDDEYQAGSSTSRARHGRRSRRKRQVDSLDYLPANEASPLSRQKQISLEAFSLFFPDVPPANLEAQKIRMSDLQRVFKLLGEKIKTDEMLEMLDLFSSSADRTMDINDFTRMMVAAKLA